MSSASRNGKIPTSEPKRYFFFAFVYYFIESFINLEAMFIILKCLLYRTNLKFFVEFQPYLCVIFIDIAPRKRLYNIISM